MSQNVSSAVMAQRKEPHDSLDFFPTPLWATRALCEYLTRQHCEGKSVWEPACGEGHMVRVLKEYFQTVHASDVHSYGQDIVDDFLFDFPDAPDVDWIITNPPFRLAAEFAHTGIERAKIGVALFVRIAFLEGIARFRTLFTPHRPTTILQFTERVPLLKGRVEQGATTATAYCWILWSKPHPMATQFTWIAPCRAKLEREGDY